jgi:hypothetical protein
MDAVVNLSAVHHAKSAPVALRESVLAADTQAVAIIQFEVCKTKKVLPAAHYAAAILVFDGCYSRKRSSAKLRVRT